jgi:hypothetical protein
VLGVVGVLEAAEVSVGAGEAAARTTLEEVFPSALPVEPPPPHAASSTVDAQAVLIQRYRNFLEQVFEIINIAFHVQIGLNRSNQDTSMHLKFQQAHSQTERFTPRVCEHAHI